MFVSPAIKSPLPKGSCRTSSENFSCFISCLLKVGKCQLAFADLQNTRFPRAAALTALPIDMYVYISMALPVCQRPVRSPSEGACTSGVALFHSSREPVQPPRETRHGLCTELHTLHVAFYIFIVAVYRRVLRRRCRRRWTRQAHVHGGHVQRGGAHCPPLCHVLRPVVSEELPDANKLNKRIAVSCTAMCVFNNKTYNRETLMESWLWANRRVSKEAN